MKWEEYVSLVEAGGAPYAGYPGQAPPAGLGITGYTGAGTTTPPTTTPPTTGGPIGGNINPYTGKPFTTADLSGMGVATVKDFWNFYNQGLIQKVNGQYKYVGEPDVVGTGGWGENVPVPYNVPGEEPPAVTPTPEEQIEDMPEIPPIVAPTLAPTPTVTPAPTFGAPTVPPIPAVTPAPMIEPTEVAPAPEYAPTEEEKMWAEMYGGTIEDIIKARGEGIPEETVNLMIRQQTQALTAREDENLRIMHNDMERRGITNSGLVFWNQQKIKSATTTALANSITDIQIKSALMRMASFENALGHAGQFLGYLQEQSKMVYVGKMATWEAQTQANLIQYQAQISADIEQWRMVNQFNLADWQANTQALFAQWEMNSTAMIEAWKMENVFSMQEWQTRANYDMAVFQIQTEALMAKWSAQCDIYKLGIAQAYLQDNMNLQAQINEDAAEQQHLDNLELQEIKNEAANQAAATKGFWSMLGTTAGWIFKVPS